MNFSPIPEDSPDARKFVIALARGLMLSRAFQPGETMLGNCAFAERTGLPKATVNRLVYTLTTLGYLLYGASSGQYVLDAAVLSLGDTYLQGADLLVAARPHMQLLATEINAAVSLDCRAGVDMIYLETIRRETVLTLGLTAGARLFLLTSSIGRAYWAVLIEVERTALFAELKRVAGKSKAAAAGVAVAEAAIAAFAEDGCCHSFCDWHADVNAAAAPFREPREGRWLILGCSGPTSLVDEVMFRNRIGPKLKARARHLGVAAPVASR